MPGKYDVIVIGAGVAGLSGAIHLAQHGKKVLLVEQNPVPGGYCISFKRKGFTFNNPAAIVTAGTDKTVGGLWKELGVLDKVKFIKLAHFICFAFPDLRIHLPETLDLAKAMLQDMFPKDTEGIEWFFSTAIQLDSGTASAEVVRSCLTTSTDDMLASRIKDVRLRSCLGGLFTQGTSPKQAVIADRMSRWVMHYRQGSFYPRGGFQKLADAMAEVFIENGGVIKYRTRAEKVILEGGRVAGVEFDNATRAIAPAVLAASDARHTFLKMAGKENLPSDFVKQLLDRKAGLSSVCVWLGIDVDPIKQWKLSIMTFTQSVQSLADAHELIVQGKFGERMTVICQSAMESSLAPGGFHTVKLFSMAPYDCPGVDWKTDKEAIEQRMMHKAEELLPGLSRHIVIRETSTPATNVRYTSNYMGALGGWEATPQNLGENALQQKTPLEGLYLAGQWTLPGNGLNRCIVSGRQAAEMILNSH